MKNFISKVAEALKPKPSKRMFQGLAVTEEGKLASDKTFERGQRAAQAPSDVASLAGLLKQNNDSYAIQKVLRSLGLPTTGANKKIANTALNLQAMAKLRDRANPTLGFDTSIETAFKNAQRRHLNG